MQKAGTNLRGMLTSLVKPTKQNTEGFKSMGISSKQLAHDSHDLPQLIDDITHGTKGWTNAERGKALAQAFGRENQAAANALVKAGSKSLRDLTKDTENAGGATKKVAEQMSNTSANNVKKLIASLQVLGIEIGEKLIPKLTPLVKKATDMVQGFSKMDDATQNTIIKFALLAAAGGPVLSMLGNIVGGFGTFGGGIVQVISKTAQWHAKNQATKESLSVLKGATDATSGGFKAFKGSVDTVNGSASTAKSTFGLLKGAFTTAEAGAGVLGSSLSVTGAALTGVGIAAVAGIAYWEGYGKQASESASRVRQWGSDIGKSASDAATDMTSFETQASTALDNFNGNAQKNSKDVQKAFKDMVDSSSKHVDKEYKDALATAQKIGGTAGEAIKEEAEKQKTANEKKVADMASTAKKVNEITSKSAKDGVKFTSDQLTTVANLQRKMAQDEIDTLGLKSKQKKAILAAELGETGSMTKKQLAENAKSIGDAAYTEVETYNKKQGKIAQAQKDGLITDKEANAAQEALTKEHNATVSQLADDYIKTQVAAGKNAGDAANELHDKYGLLEKDSDAAFKRYENSAKKSTSVAVKVTGDMSKATEKAANSWNSIVLDPKTGKLKTNAQDEVNKAAKSKDKWNSMLLLAKQGKMSSNAAAMVGVAAVQTGRWDGLTLKEKQAMIRSKGGDDLAELLQKGKQWGKFTPAEKKAIITAKGKPELLGIMTQAKTWNKLTVAEKKAVLKDNASPVMKQAKVSVDDWNKLTPQMKTVLAKAKGTDDVINGIKNVKDWNSLPEKEKKAIVNSKGGPKLADLLIKSKEWDKLSIKDKQALIHSKGGDDLASLLEKGKQWGKFTPDEKKAIVTSKGKPELLSVMTKVQTWNKLTLAEKRAVLKDNASPAMKQASVGVKDWNNLTPQMKTVMAKAKGAEDVAKGVKNVKDWNSLPTSEKKLIANDKGATGVIKKVTGNYKSYQNLPKNATKNLFAKDNASKNAGKAKISVDKYGRVKVTGKVLKATDKASGPAKNGKKGLDKFNSTKMQTKNARGKDSASSPLNGARKSALNYNGVNMALKTARGHDSASSPINGARGSLNRYNGTGMRGKTAIGRDSASGAMNRATGSLGRYNGTGMRSKTASGRDGASGPISRAIGTLSHWNAMGNVTHTITTIFRKITGHAMGTTGTDGNPIVVNDQEGPMFREAVKYPGRPAFIPNGRNVYLDAPKGTQVIPAGLTAKMFSVSQYAAGTIPANSSIIKASKAINDSIAGDSTTINYNVDSNTNSQAIVAGLEAILAKLDDQQPTFEVHNDMIGDKLRTLIKQKDSREHNLNRFFPTGG